MARAKQVKLYRTFVKGLITEAGPLTYPENASIAEDNCIIYRTGNRSRRLGISLESTGVVQDLDPVTFHTKAVSEYTWEGVGENPNLDFGVIQLGQHLIFFDVTDEPVTSGFKIFNVDMSEFVVAGYTNHETVQVSMTAGKGYLFVSGEAYEPFLVQYNATTDSIITQRIYIQIRDFKGLADGLANDQEPTTLSAAHHYNLRNQGWVDSENAGGGTSVSYFNQFGGVGIYNAPPSTPITTYHTAIGRYPGNNKQWWTARNSTDLSFEPDLLVKGYSGTTLAPRGHYVVNAFSVDRSAVSGVSGLPVESSPTRPNSVAFANSRAWYGHNSNLYFSQVLDDKSKAGFCYQEADPTSEDISDLIATDGGVIPIPEMAKCVRLIPSGGGIVVFATNGVWFVGGTQSGFSALDLSVSKISPIGTESPGSIVEVDGQIYWWSRIGIMAMTQKQGMFGAIEGVFEKNNITEQTIQTFYNAIPDTVRQTVKVVYDPLTNIIQWLYQDETVVDRPYTYNKILNLDLTLQAFYPWTVSRVNDSTPDIIGVMTTPVPAGYKGALSVSPRLTYIKYPCIVPDGGSYRIAFAESNNIDFLDWGTETFNSYVETGYELLEDAMRKKQAPWITTYFRRTEENYVEDGDDYTTDRQSSCMFQIKWDWASSSISNKYSTKREAYRIVRQPAFSVDDLTFDTGFPLVVSKHKVRGNGRSIQFRFESDAAYKDFDLYGWSTVYTGNTEV